MGTGTKRTGEEEHFLSGNPPPPAYTKATCPWRENTMPLFPSSFPRPLRHRTSVRRPCTSVPDRRIPPGHRWSPRVRPACHPQRSPRAGRALQGLGGGKRGLMPPLKMLQAGRAPDGEDKEQRSELLERCIMIVSPSRGGKDGTPAGAPVGVPWGERSGRAAGLCALHTTPRRALWGGRGRGEEEGWSLFSPSDWTDGARAGAAAVTPGQTQPRGGGR